MKFCSCVVFSCLLTFVLLLHGPAVDQQHRYRYTEEDTDEEETRDENSYCDVLSAEYEETSSLFSKSYCIDKNLHWPDGIYDELTSINKGNEYYDHCCYVRYQSQGTIYHGCKGVKELDYLDIKETAYKYEQQYNIKVLEISCNSSYTYLSVAVIISFFGLLL